MKCNNMQHFIWVFTVCQIPVKGFQYTKGKALCILMDSPLWFDTMHLEWSIECIAETHVIASKQYCFAGARCEKMCLQRFANNIRAV